MKGKRTPSAAKPGTRTTPDDASRSSGGRGAANSGTKKASNARAAKRQGDKAEANKASNRG